MEDFSPSEFLLENLAEEYPTDLLSKHALAQ